MAMTLQQDLTESQKLLVIQNNQIQLATDTEKLKKTVYGNGEAGLDEQVRKNTEFIKDIKYWIRFIGGALVLQTLAFLVGIIVAVARFLPVLERLANQP